MDQTTLSPLLSYSAASDFLLVESGSLAGQQFPLPQAPGALLLGRERLCNVRFDPERDRVVGRTHARIEVRADGIFLVDLNSANGTFRGDGSAVRGEIRLNAGDRFQLGGEGGPWLSLQAAAAKEAVHIAPPASDMPTLVTPALAPSAVAKLQSVPAPPPSSTPSPPAPAAPLRQPILPAEPAPPRGGHYEARSPARREPDPVRRQEAPQADPVVLQQQTQYRRQIAAIAILLLLACSVGLALGLREVSSEDHAETSRSE